jgi:hypothetical protein
MKIGRIAGCRQIITDLFREQLRSAGQLGYQGLVIYSGRLHIDEPHCHGGAKGWIKRLP